MLYCFAKTSPILAIPCSSSRSLLARNSVSFIVGFFRRASAIILAPAGPSPQLVTSRIFKDELYAKNNIFKPNFPIFIFIGSINIESIIHNEDLKKKYESVFLNNVFLNIDGIGIYDNKSSIFEALIHKTIGICTDKLSREIISNFEVLTKQTFLI